MSQKLQINSVCPKCSKSIMLNVDIPEKTLSLHDNIPKVRGGIEPVGKILEYRFSSEDLKKFIIDKARQYVPEVLIEVVPRYCSKKIRNSIRSYASLRIAFSENIISNNQDLGWFGSIGENENNIKLHEGIMKGLIDKYKYNEKDIKTWLNDYKILEELEESFGMTEKYIRDLYLYAIPRRIKDTSNGNGKNKSWIIFEAATESVIKDFLTDKTNNKLPGRIQIQEISSSSRDIVHFTVYVYPEQEELKENPNVRKMLLG